jgi:hypothetical protein
MRKHTDDIKVAAVDRSLHGIIRNAQTPSTNRTKHLHFAIAIALGWWEGRGRNVQHLAVLFEVVALGQVMVPTLDEIYTQ